MCITYILKLVSITWQTQDDEYYLHIRVYGYSLQTWVGGYYLWTEVEDITYGPELVGIHNINIIILIILIKYYNY